MKFENNKYDPNDVFKKYPVLPEGNYWFEILKAPQVESKSHPGKQQIEVWIRIYDDKGNEGRVSYYITDSVKAYPIRLRERFCKAIGKADLFDKAQITTDDLIQAKGYCKVKIEKRAGYDDRNGIADFIPANEAPAQAVIINDVPF